MKKLALLMCALLLMVFAFAGCGSEKKQAPPAPVAVVHDCSQYGGMTAKELTAKLGKPEHVSNWKLTGGLIIYPIKTYDYTIDGNRAEFHMYDNKVVSLRMYCQPGMTWFVNEPKQIGCDDTFAMFGIKKSESMEYAVDAPARKKYTSVAENIVAVEVFPIREKYFSKTKFDQIHIIYDEGVAKNYN